jgi:hypothetical protein
MAQGYALVKGTLNLISQLEQNGGRRRRLQILMIAVTG